VREQGNILKLGRHSDALLKANHSGHGPIGLDEASVRVPWGHIAKYNIKTTPEACDRELGLFVRADIVFGVPVIMCS
jgi:hypothetical protein